MKSLWKTFVFEHNFTKFDTYYNYSFFVKFYTINDMSKKNRDLYLPRPLDLQLGALLNNNAYSTMTNSYVLMTKLVVKHFQSDFFVSTYLHIFRF